MLISKKYRSPRPKMDWYNPGRKAHFDCTLTKISAEKMVSSTTTVAAHQFLPLISFDKIERRYRSRPNGKPRSKIKIRPLVYASNKDGYIYSYYSKILGDQLNILVKRDGLDDVVVGYRSGRSNITIAKSVFDEISKRGSCTALAYDIKSFFDNIHHGILKENWKIVLGLQNLPVDHMNVFKALTCSRLVNRDDCFERLGLDPKTKPLDLPTPLCSLATFRAKICGGDPALPSLILKQRVIGIPQGTPLSAVAANIAMFTFDKAINAEIAKLGGSYRRYSDDILIICPTPNVKDAELAFTDLLKFYTKTLKISSDKTLKVGFVRKGHAVKGRPLQYLGFTFDGRKRLLRAGTLSRFYSRVTSGIAWAKRQEYLVKKGKLPGRPVLYRRELHARFLHLGKKTFVTGYATRSDDGIGNGSQIRCQLSRHHKFLERLVKASRVKRRKA